MLESRGRQDTSSKQAGHCALPKRIVEEVRIARNTVEKPSSEYRVSRRALFRAIRDGRDVSWACDVGSAEMAAFPQQRPKLVRIRKQPCTIRTFPLSDPTPPRLSSAIAIVAFRITFFGSVGAVAGLLPYFFAIFSECLGASRFAGKELPSHDTGPPIRPQLDDHRQNTARAVQHMSRNLKLR